MTDHEKKWEQQDDDEDIKILKLSHIIYSVSVSTNILTSVLFAKLFN
jgi:hypothetical protein